MFLEEVGQNYGKIESHTPLNSIPPDHSQFFTQWQSPWNHMAVDTQDPLYLWKIT
jgi:hypothetical protein